MINKKILLTGTGHLCLALIVYLTFYRFNIVTTFPNEKNLLNWDADWFNSIRTGGYQFKANVICNLAFFPLFPYLWKLTMLNGVGISIVNSAIFIVSLAYLLKDESFSYTFLLFIFSTASFIFFALPYSESLFFLFAVLILRGYKTGSRIMMVAGFFFACMVRSVAMIFVPAIIICGFFSSKMRWNEMTVKTMVYNILASAMGLFLSSLIQFQQTHKWLYFLTIQKIWGREWLFPGFPLTSTYPERTMGIDSAAFIVGVFAIFYCFKYIFLLAKMRFSNQHTDFEIDLTTMFSILCLAGITVLDTCFTFKIGLSSNIWSINRHIFCSPFYIAFIIWFYKRCETQKIEQIFMLLFILSGIYFTGLYQYPNLILYYLLFFFSFYILKYMPSYSKYLGLVYVFGVFLQVLVYQDFLRYLWIG